MDLRDHIIPKFPNLGIIKDLKWQAKSFDCMCALFWGEGPELSSDSNRDSRIIKG